METLSYIAVRENLADAMDRVCSNREPLIITRTGRKSVVMMSLEDYKAIEETAHLLSSPHNARRLLEAIDDLESGTTSNR